MYIYSQACIRTNEKLLCKTSDHLFKIGQSILAALVPIRISGVMVSVLPLNAVDRGFEPRLGPTKDYKIGICFFSAKHATLRRKNKDWLARNQDNVAEWANMCIHGLLFM